MDIYEHVAAAQKILRQNDPPNDNRMVWHDGMIYKQEPTTIQITDLFPSVRPVAKVQNAK